MLNQHTYSDRRRAGGSVWLAAVLLIAVVSVGQAHSSVVPPPPDIAPAAAHTRDDDEAAMRVAAMSFNIRFGTARDGANHWEHRSDACMALIDRLGGDFIGLQEAMRFQIDAIRETCHRYDEVGVGRADGEDGGEHCTILYDTGRWRIDDDQHGTFWLSDTPEEIASTSWGNTIPRIVTWARFIERDSNRSVWVFNTHFDHRSQLSREQSAVLLARRIADRAMPKEPVIVMGDFNAGEQNPAMQYLIGEGAIDGERAPQLLLDTFRAVHPDAQTVGTFTGFTVGRTDGEKIDAVLMTPGSTVLDAAIVRETYTDDDGAKRYPSDHFPVTAVIRWDASDVDESDRSAAEGEQSAR